MSKKSKRRKDRDRIKLEEANERSKQRASRWQNRSVFNDDGRKPAEVRRVEITDEMRALYERKP